jgi:hypothetical protein
MFRRVFRVTLKLGIIAAVGVGIAIVVKRLTTPPEVAFERPDSPWPSVSVPSQPAEPVADDTSADNGSIAADETVVSSSS